MEENVLLVALLCLCQQHTHVVPNNLTTTIKSHFCLFIIIHIHIYIYIYIQWGKKVFSQPPIVQVLPLKKMREACNFHHRYASTMRDKIRKKIQKITL